MIDKQSVNSSIILGTWGTGPGGTNLPVIASLITKNLGEDGNYLITVSGFWSLSLATRIGALYLKVGTTVYASSRIQQKFNSSGDKMPFTVSFLVPTTVPAGTTIEVKAGIPGPTFPCGGALPACPVLTIESFKFIIEGVPNSKVI